jgi:hypothetical protein
MKTAILILIVSFACAESSLITSIANGVWNAMKKDLEKQAVKIVYEGVIKEGIKIAIAEGIPKIKEIGTGNLPLPNPAPYRDLVLSYGTKVRMSLNPTQRHGY